MQTQLKNMQLVGTILMSAKNKPIVQLYLNNGYLMLLDVVLSTRFENYYAYEINLDDLSNFINKKDNNHLSPKIDQLIYTVTSNDFNVLEMYKCQEQNLTNFTMFSEKTWECLDLELIQSKLYNIKN